MILSFISLLEDEEPSDVEGEGEDDSSSVNSDEFYDAEDEPAITENVVTSPSVSIPAAEGDPSGELIIARKLLQFYID